MINLAAERTANKVVEQLLQDTPEFMVAHRVPGLSVALIQDATLFWSGEFGIESVVSQTPVTEKTLFEAASLSKPVFAYAALKLCEAGLLELDRPLADYLPDLYIEDEPRLDLITMRHVLSHTPGFPNWREQGQPLRMIFTPGERFSYSGEGYMYLQAVIAHVTGQEPAQFMRDAVLNRFGMYNSRFVLNGEEGALLAIGHDAQGQIAEKFLWKEMYAAASLHSTPVEFAKFLCAIMQPAPNGTADLSEAMITEMLSVQVQVSDAAKRNDNVPEQSMRHNPNVGWGLGWGIQRTSAGVSIWHWGDNGNYRAFTLGHVADRYGIVIMTNGRNGQKVIDHILREIIGGDYPALDWLDRRNNA